MKTKKIIALACMTMYCGWGALAGEIQQTAIIISATQKDPAKVKETGWYELRGSLNSNPVYLMVEKIGVRQVAGYLFDGNGKSQYIYGEWFKNELQVYDQFNKRLTILLAE